MKTLRAVALVMVLAGSAYAGDIQNPDAPPPAPEPSSACAAIMPNARIEQADNAREPRWGKSRAHPFPFAASPIFHATFRTVKLWLLLISLCKEKTFTRLPEFLLLSATYISPTPAAHGDWD